MFQYSLKVSDEQWTRSSWWRGLFYDRVFWGRSKVRKKFRNSRPDVFCEKGVLKKFTRKQLCQGLFLIKLQARKRNRDRCFPVKISKNTCFEEHLAMTAPDNWFHTTSGNSQSGTGRCSLKKLSLKLWVFLINI